MASLSLVGESGPRPDPSTKASEGRELTPWRGKGGDGGGVWGGQSSRVSCRISNRATSRGSTPGSDKSSVRHFAGSTSWMASRRNIRDRRDPSRRAPCSTTDAERERSRIRERERRPPRPANPIKDPTCRRRPRGAVANLPADDSPVGWRKLPATRQGETGMAQPDVSPDGEHVRTSGGRLWFHSSTTRSSTLTPKAVAIRAMISSEPPCLPDSRSATCGWVVPCGLGKRRLRHSAFGAPKRERRRTRQAARQPLRV